MTKKPANSTTNKAPITQKKKETRLSLLLKSMILLLFFLSYGIYLYWRFEYTIPLKFGIVSIIAGSILFLAEAVGFFESAVFYYTLWNTDNEPTPKVSTDDFPEVDIFVATYNEPEELLYKTLVGCKNMDYPDKRKVHIHVCDDGNRESMKRLCESLGVNYITRTENTHAKAGNLNNALKQTSAPCVVTFDADMIPMHDFLMVTIPYFVAEEKVGFVQVPQNFYNPDLFQYNLFTEKNMPNEQDLFSRLIQAGKARFNAVIYAGSNTVLSRAALDEIGGLVTGTITEDFATGMKIQSLGYKSKYVNEVHASGLSPESLEDLYNQRIRWGRGVIQTFKAFNPMFMKGLGLVQKILYLSTFSYWYFGLWRLIFFLAPILFSVFGVVVLTADAWQMLAIWFPMFLFTNITFRYFSKSVRTVSWSHIYDTILFPQILTGVMKETFGVKMSKFKVTPKEVVKRESFINRFELVKFQILLLALSLIGVVRIIYLYVSHDFQTQYIINFFWLVYNVYIFSMAIFFASERPKFRNGERITAREAILIHNSGTWHEGYTQDLSETGVTIVLKEPVCFLEEVVYDIRLETSRYISELKGTIVRVDEMGDSYKYIFAISEITEKDKEQLLMILYDRVPQFPRKQNKNTMLSNIIQNTKRRRSKIIPMNRKYPRIKLNKEVWIIRENEEEHFPVVDFNYVYITSTKEILDDSFTILVKNEELLGLECTLDKELTNSVNRGLYFYHITNYNPEYGVIKF